MKRKKNNLHLTITDRREIENLLNEGKTITEISNIIYKDRSNISREIKNISILICHLLLIINGIA